MNNYKGLKIWQEAVDLAHDIYRLTEKFPREEVYGLTSQLRRAVVSIASNISEGASRNNDGEFRHFLGIANGSTAEADTQLVIAMRLGYITNDIYEEYLQRIEGIQKMNYKLQKRILETVESKKLKTQDPRPNTLK